MPGAADRSESFTAASGTGFIAAGLLALAAAPIAAAQPTRALWLTTWLAVAVLSLLVAGGATLRKARRGRPAAVAGAERKLLRAFVPPAAVGALLTPFLAAAGPPGLLPALWLLLYGAAVVTSGTWSVRIIPAMGASFMVLGAASMLSPVTWADAYMAAGFGGLHVAFGGVIAREHGG